MQKSLSLFQWFQIVFECYLHLNFWLTCFIHGSCRSERIIVVSKHDHTDQSSGNDDASKNPNDEGTSVSVTLGHSDVASNITTERNRIGALQPSTMEHPLFCTFIEIILSKFEYLFGSIFSKHRFESYKANIKGLCCDSSFLCVGNRPFII